jgi:hypothetical protein
MPMDSAPINDLPSSFVGEYLDIFFDSTSVHANLWEISTISNQQYLIKNTTISFIDSTTWVLKKMGNIQTVNLTDSYIEILTTNNRYEYSLSDTLSSNFRLEQYELNLKDGFFYDELDNEHTKEASRRKCQLNKKEDIYYLNIQYLDKYWLPTKIEYQENQLIVNRLLFSSDDSDKLEFNKLKLKYSLNKIELDFQAKIQRKHYLANNNDDEMESIFQENLFNEHHLFKIPKKNYSPIWFVGGSFFLLICGLSLKKLQKQP